MEETTLKKLFALLLAVGAVLTACGRQSADIPRSEADKIADEMTSSDGRYEIAFVTDVGQLKDKSFNQGTYDGVKLYAAKNGKTYKYYMPGGGDQATDDDRIAAMKAACENGAKVVIAAGFMQENALKAAAIAYPGVSFLFIDGYPVSDDNGNVLTNIAGIRFREEQSGYLAGYAAVMEGYTKLGFTGGGGGTNPACCRFGYGFVQGADAAAAVKGITVEVKYSWLHGANFSPSNELQTMTAGWYRTGTEVIFCCGGGMFTSVAAAAGTEDGWVIGVDIDQSGDSPTVITSATKGLADAVQWALNKYYAGEFAALGGTATALGAREYAIGLPTDSWFFKNWSVAEYEAVLAKLADGTLTVDDNWNDPKTADNVNLNIIA